MAERQRVEALRGEERRAQAEGFAVVAGLDEVGRGCLAGPVYAGAVVLGEDVPLGLDDSKVLLPAVREDLAARLLRTAVGAAVGAATPAEIDAIGIAGATFLAMRRALAALRAAGVSPDLLLLDAFRIPGLDLPQRPIVKGDAKVAAIAAASVVAKTARDAYMEKLDASLPYYGFARHAGYATPEHLAAIRRHGPSPAHRLTFDRVLGTPSGRPGPAARAA